MKNELTFHNLEGAFVVANSLIKENYVVMLSTEENLIVLNYCWAPDGNRNYVVFGDADEYYYWKEDED